MFETTDTNQGLQSLPEVFIAKEQNEYHIQVSELINFPVKEGDINMW